MDRKELGTALRQARENREISQQAAAKQVGLSRTVIAQIELGNRPVSPDELAKLAELYNRTFAKAYSPDALGQMDAAVDVLR